MLIIKAHRKAKDVILRCAASKCFHKCGLITLRICFVGEKILCDLSSTIQGVVGTEASSSKWFSRCLRVNLFEGVIAQNSIASTISAQIENHFGFSSLLGRANEITHCILETLNIWGFVRWYAENSDVLHSLAEILIVSKIRKHTSYPAPSI